MTKEQLKQLYKPESKWYGRSLDNYKKMQAKVAASNGVGEQLKNATTLTQARKIVYGVKGKQLKLKK